MPLIDIVNSARESFSKINHWDHEGCEAIEGLKGDERTSASKPFWDKKKEEEEKLQSLLKTSINIPDDIKRRSNGLTKDDFEIDNGCYIPSREDLNRPARIQLNLEIDEERAKKLDFGRIYPVAFENQGTIPDLDYTAYVSLNQKEFMNEDHLDLRVISSIRAHRKASSFSKEPFLSRRNYNDRNLQMEFVAGKEIDVSFVPKNGEAKFRVVGDDRSHLPGDSGEKNEYTHNRLWNQQLYDIAEKFDGKLKVEISGKRYEELTKDMSLKDKLKTYWTINSLLNADKPSRAAMTLGQEMMKEFAKRQGMDLKDTKQKRRTDYEGTVTFNEFKKLQEILGIDDLIDYVDNVTVQTGSLQDPKTARQTLRDIVHHLDQAQLSNPKPGEYAITIEEAKEFIQKDIESLPDKIADISKHSIRIENDPFLGPRLAFYYTVDTWGFDGLNLSRKISKLTHLNFGEYMTLAKLDLKKYREVSVARADRYEPGSIEELTANFNETKVPKEVLQESLAKLTQRKSEEHENGYLTLHELYGIQEATLKHLNQTDQENLVAKYRELYKQEAAVSKPVSINIHRSKGIAEYRSKLPPPSAMVMDVDSFGFDDMKERGSLREQKISFGYSSHYKKHIISVQIIPDNPTLLPIQEKVLETIGIKFN